MNLYNNKVSRRWNNFIRNTFIIPRMRKCVPCGENITLLSNNCLGGVILHDFGLPFNTPTINLYFQGLDFFVFLEHLNHYLSADLQPCVNPRYKPDNLNYPIMSLSGSNSLPDLELHFSHYHSIDEAIDAWNRRKARINMDRIFAVWTFSFNEFDYDMLLPRFENIKIKNKIAFINHPVDSVKYPHCYYIKGFEKNSALGQVLSYENLFGKRFYDQFDFAKWLTQSK